MVFSSSYNKKNTIEEEIIKSKLKYHDEDNKAIRIDSETAKNQHQVHPERVN